MRLNVNLSDSTYQELRCGADSADMGMSEYVRSALKVIKFLRDERKQGNCLYIGKDGKITKEVVFLP